VEVKERVWVTGFENEMLRSVFWRKKEGGSKDV